MKTTIEISDALLKAAKREARARGLTLRALVEDGLRHVLSAEPRARFELRRVTFGGDGLSPEVRNWDDVRELIYRDGRE